MQAITLRPWESAYATLSATSCHDSKKVDITKDKMSV
jgi:hypothetical protein